MAEYMVIYSTPERSVKDYIICDALHDLVPFLQFKKREKHPWWSATFIKVAG